MVKTDRNVILLKSMYFPNLFPKYVVQNLTLHLHGSQGSSANATTQQHTAL